MLDEYFFFSISQKKLEVFPPQVTLHVLFVEIIQYWKPAHLPSLRILGKFAEGLPSVDN